MLMLIGIILTVELTGKEKHTPYTTISLNKVNLIEMTPSSYIILFFKKNVAVAVLYTYADQTSVLPTAKICPVLNK